MGYGRNGQYQPFLSAETGEAKTICAPRIAMHTVAATNLGSGMQLLKRMLDGLRGYDDRRRWGVDT
jgi:hypothetical protein